MEGKKNYSKPYFYERKHQIQIYQEIKKKTELQVVKNLLELVSLILNITYSSSMKNYLSQRINKLFCIYIC